MKMMAKMNGSRWTSNRRAPACARVVGIGCWVVALLALPGAARLHAAEAADVESVESPTRVLLSSLVRLGIGSQVADRAGELARGADARGAVEITAAVDAFRDGLGARSREELGRAFGAAAREEFGLFVDRFTQAEQDGDLAFLGRIVPLAGPWEGAPPAAYPALRAALIESALAGDVQEAGRFLADVQTWLDLRRRAVDVPGLQGWLGRGAQTATETEAPPPRPRNRLRDAEAPAAGFTGGDEEADGALAQFGAARTERRQKALEDARAGMQQVAEERRAAEEEVAAKKLAAAQAEADAVRKQAEKLAAAEGEAIEQRRNSWSGRLKSVLTTAIGATSGAFLGNVGSRAGEAAANAIFNTDGHSHGHPPPGEGPPR